MKKTRLAAMLLCLAAVLSVPAAALEFEGAVGWNVVFTDRARMESNFRTAELDDAVYGLQPGDAIGFTVSLQNAYPADTDWYMTNKVLYSLEDRSANAATGGGAYSYRLAYTDSAGQERVLFSSDTVGGEDISPAGEGLREATDALDEFFYLDTLRSGEEGIVTLWVELEGETQGNDYQDTLADLQMNFAVELRSTGTHARVVKTGDGTNLTPYYIAMLISGVLLLVLFLDGLRKRRREAAQSR